MSISLSLIYLKLVEVFDVEFFLIKFWNFWPLFLQPLLCLIFSLSLLILGFPLCGCWYGWMWLMGLRVSVHFSLFFFYFSGVISIFLSSLLILSSFSSNLLLSPLMNFYFTYFIFQLQKFYLFLFYNICLFFPLCSEISS